jgi:hypothetical protein
MLILFVDCVNKHYFLTNKFSLQMLYFKQICRRPIMTELRKKTYKKNVERSGRFLFLSGSGSGACGLNCVLLLPPIMFDVFS